LKLGTESGGGFKNIRIADITVHSPRETTHIYGRDRGLAAIASTRSG
jgi:polygalacturonase